MNAIAASESAGFAPLGAIAARAGGGLAADGLLLLTLIHASAALVHHFVFEDGVLRRMWPQR